jgi:hypothetical protein
MNREASASCCPVCDARWHQRDEMGRNWNIGLVINGTAYIAAVRAMI